MWWAGVGWQGEGFEIAVADRPDGPMDTTRVPGGRAEPLVDLLRGYADRAGDEGFAVVVDSTNGVVDGYLTASGLPVYRADPPRLPARPGFGSVPAAALVRCAFADPGALPELTVATGTLAGRVEEYAAALARSAAVERGLIRAGRYLERNRTDEPAVALTFDDGPHPVFTPRVLEILARYQVPATFFCVGMNAAAHPDLLGQVLDGGHAVGNHTWSHPYLPDLSRDELLRQVDETGAAISRVTGAPVRLFRPPYGSRTPEVLTWLAGHGMTTVVWDVDARDWSAPGAPAIAAAVGACAAAGSIVLLHDGGGDRRQTVAALPTIVENLLERGHRLATLTP
jgi:peptidoglycan/xylan/chitin deacetylase (PgdA/CDA1 family)